MFTECFQYVAQNSTLGANIYGLPQWLSDKEPSTMQEMWQEPWVQFLGQKGSMEKEMATQSSILAWKKSHGQPMGLQKRQI